MSRERASNPRREASGNMFGNSNGNGNANGNGVVNEERRRSFGIGGAGNIRRPSDVIYPVRRASVAENDPDPDKAKRRRGSGWSMGTSPGKNGILSFWRKGNDV